MRYGWLSDAKVSGATVFVKGVMSVFCRLNEKYLEVGMPAGCKG
jgi:hypothetical protein